MNSSSGTSSGASSHSSSIHSPHLHLNPVSNSSSFASVQLHPPPDINGDRSLEQEEEEEEDEIFGRSKFAKSSNLIANPFSKSPDSPSGSASGVSTSSTDLTKKSHTTIMSTDAVVKTNAMVVRHSLSPADSNCGSVSMVTDAVPGGSSSSVGIDGSTNCTTNSSMLTTSASCHQISSHGSSSTSTRKSSSPIPGSSSNIFCSPSTGAAAGSASGNPLVQVIRDSVYSSFRYNKQRVQEHLLPLFPFPSSHSVPRPAPFLLKSTDPVLESRIAALKASRCQLKQVLRVTSGPILTSLNTLCSSFSQLNSLLSDLNSSRFDFSKGSCTSIETARGQRAGDTEQQLRDLTCTLRLLSAETEKMKAGIEFLNANMDTLVRKSMEDTLSTCSNLEVARIEYDAERNYLLSSAHIATGSGGAGGASSGPSSGAKATTNNTEATGQTTRVAALENKYNTLKSDVSVKLDFLSANKDKVLNKSLSLMHALVTSYFHPLPGSTASRSKLDQVLRAYSIKNPLLVARTTDTTPGKE